MPTYISLRPYPSYKDLAESSARLDATVDPLGIVKRMLTYVFEVQGQGLVAASCYEAPDMDAMTEMARKADLPEGMVRTVLLDRQEGAGVHGPKSHRTYVVNRGKVCSQEDLEKISERSLAAEAQLTDELKRMETWMYDDDDQVGMLSIYQSKSTKAIRHHAELADLPVVDIFEARIAS
jgi:hypothetical protein